VIKSIKLYICFFPLPCTYVTRLKNPKIFQRILWAYLLQTLTRPHLSTFVTNGFKGLCVKCNCDFYDSELVFRILLEYEQKLGVGVFVSMIYDTILCSYLPSFWFV